MNPGDLVLTSVRTAKQFNRALTRNQLVEVTGLPRTTVNKYVNKGQRSGLYEGEPNRRLRNWPVELAAKNKR